MSRSITEKIEIKADSSTVFEALIMPSAIQKYWGVNAAIIIPEQGGFISMTWGEDVDQPIYVTLSRIVDIESPNKLVLKYENYKGMDRPLSFIADIMVEYKVTAQEGLTRLTVQQTGIPDDSIADEYYEGCIKGWRDTLGNIKRYLEEA